MERMQSRSEVEVKSKWSGIGVEVERKWSGSGVNAKRKWCRTEEEMK